LENKNLDGAIPNMVSAVNATQGMYDSYLTDLSQLYLYKAQEVMAAQNKDISPEEAVKAIEPYVKNAIDASRLAADSANANNVSNWSVRGYVYQQLIGIVSDADTWALKSYETAVKLEPENPYLLTQLGQLQIVKKDLNRAKESFSKAIALNPNYSNARYFLGLIYDQEGNKDAALQEFNFIQQLNPGNNDIAKIIENLKAGKPAFGDPVAQQQIEAAQSPSLEDQVVQPGALPVVPGNDNAATSTGAQISAPRTGE